MLHDVVVLHGGVIHWMVRNTHEIVSYNICTMEQGTVSPPALAASFKGLLCLGSYYSNDGQKLLRLLASKGVKIYVWHQLANEQWALEPVTIDMERSYCRYTLVSTSVIFCLPSSYGPARGATWWCCAHIRIICAQVGGSSFLTLRRRRCTCIKPQLLGLPCSWRSICHLGCVA
jgi:hypothetical protein